jgi:hypothetical protein
LGRRQEGGEETKTRGRTQRAEGDKGEKGRGSGKKRGRRPRYKGREKEGGGWEKEGEEDGRERGLPSQITKEVSSRNEFHN